MIACCSVFTQKVLSVTGTGRAWLIRSTTRSMHHQIAGPAATPRRSRPREVPAARARLGTDRTTTRKRVHQIAAIRKWERRPRKAVGSPPW